MPTTIKNLKNYPSIKIWSKIRLCLSKMTYYLPSLSPRHDCVFTPLILFLSSTPSSLFPLSIFSPPPPPHFVATKLDFEGFDTDHGEDCSIEKCISDKFTVLKDGGVVGLNSVHICIFLVELGLDLFDSFRRVPFLAWTRRIYVS